MADGLVFFGSSGSADEQRNDAEMLSQAVSVLSVLRAGGLQTHVEALAAFALRCSRVASQTPSHESEAAGLLHEVSLLFGMGFRPARVGCCIGIQLRAFCSAPYEFLVFRIHG
jgi:hypothetical protein